MKNINEENIFLVGLLEKRYKITSGIKKSNAHNPIGFLTETILSYYINDLNTFCSLIKKIYKVIN